MPNYRVVGASWRGVDRQDERFINQRIWMLGWEQGEQAARPSQIQVGDRIAINRMKVKGQTGITILHIGVVKGVVLDTSNIICTVDWVATHLDRDITESRGCIQSVHGPSGSDDWVRQVFCL